MAADNHCVTMSQMVLATVKLLAERPRFSHGDTAANPRPAPKVTKTTERDTAADAPAKIAPHEAAGVARRRVLSSKDADEEGVPIMAVISMMRAHGEEQDNRKWHA